MSFIGKDVVDFKVQCYQENGFKEVTKEDILGKWSVFFFYPADSVSRALGNGYYDVGRTSN